jgi:hypothetical protein
MKLFFKQQVAFRVFLSKWSYEVLCFHSSPESSFVNMTAGAADDVSDLFVCVF